MLTSNLLEDAHLFAIAAHGDQKRKYTGDPYFSHCLNVATTVASVINDQEVIAAAYLHDVLEDTSVEYGALALFFGERVASFVLEVTDVSRPSDGNRKKRKTLDREHLALSSPEGATIKLADMIDNRINIDQHDESFARVYKDEGRLLLKVLQHGNAELLTVLSAALINTK